MKKIIPILLGVMIFKLINYVGMQFMDREIVLFIEVLLLLVFASALWLTSNNRKRS